MTSNAKIVFANVSEIENSETKVLIAFYNENVPEDKAVKKFADRATALKRCISLWNEIAEQAAQTVDEESAAAVEEVPVEGEVKHFWPFTKDGSQDADSKVTVPVAALMRVIIAGNQAVVGFVPAENVLTSNVAKKAFKDAVIAGLAENNGVEGEGLGIRLTEEGLRIFDKLPEGYGLKPEKTIRPLSDSSNAAGVAASWNDPSVRAQRLTRDGVSVTVEGKTTVHKSTHEAFRFYRLMDSKHIRFRGQLKAAKSLVYEEGKKSYHFQIVAIEPGVEFAKR